MQAEPQADTNRLIHETSPYLLQHAHNPVAWYPWGEEALQAAREADKPILLSIGYSACHWCHVMAHESFEDPEIAALMNRLFVNVKVDREERPDLDKIYQLSFQLLIQRTGGWPLTMFLTPQDQVPFFGGTYFPKESRWGMPAFPEVLQRVADFYHQRRDAIEEQNQAVVRALGELENVPSDPQVTLDPMPLDLARQQLGRNYDASYGGFGSAPKFPQPASIERLLRHWAGTVQQGHEDTEALDMAVHTLEQMASGGVYDHLGGGFCRYSVDDYWMIPHFEKMLYDNALLLALYGDAWQATGNPLFRKVAEETGEWVMREMQSPEGGYYSSLDADTEGEEGKFYVWTFDQVSELLDDEEFEVFGRRYGLDREANFEGRWHLYVAQDLEEVARTTGHDPATAQQLIEAARRKLFAERSQRVFPGRDEKILTSWNGLMIKAMAATGRRLGRTDFVESAERALDFLRRTVWQQDRLLATYKDGKAHLNAYLDDYAFLSEGVLELAQARWRDGELDFAIALANRLLELFEDPEAGGFFFTAADHESLIQRPKPVLDEATPAGNGVAAKMMGRLGHVVGDPAFLDAAERTLKGTVASVQQAPHAHNSILSALEEYLYPPQVIMIRGTPESMIAWHTRSQAVYAPRRVTLSIPNDAEDLPGILAQRKPLNDVTAYVCAGTQCQTPTVDFETFETQLRGYEASAGQDTA